MAIDKIGAQFVRRFKLPAKNIDLVLVRCIDNEYGDYTVTLYKNLKIPETNFDSFTIAAEKVVSPDINTIEGYLPKTIDRTQFNNRGEKIGRSKVTLDLREGYKNIKLKANDRSVEMSDGLLKIDEKGVRFLGTTKYLLVDVICEENTEKATIKFTGDKLTPMAKRVLKLFSQIRNK